MTYYKLIHGEEIVDAIIAEEAVWIHENPRTSWMYSGEQDGAKGVVSSDRKDTWHLAGTYPFAEFPDLVTVELVETTEEDYLDTIAQIEAGRVQDDDYPDAEEPSEEPVSPEAKTKVSALEERIDELAAMNEMLIECILEISEIIYG